MRRCALALSLLVVACGREAAGPYGGALGPSNERGPAPPPRRRAALLVGVGAYPKGSGWTPLRGPPNDVAAMKSRLRRLGFETVTLVDGAATEAAIRAQFFALFVERRTDVGLLYFSGHGDQVEDEDGDEADHRDERVVVHDGAITDDQLGAWVDVATAEHFVFVFDSCHSGTASRGPGGHRGLRAGAEPSSAPAPEPEPGLFFDRPGAARPGRTVVTLAAARAREEARERHRGLPIGYFTDALVEVLDAGLPATYQGLMDRIRARLRLLGLAQTPDLSVFPASSTPPPPFDLRPGPADRGWVLPVVPDPKGRCAPGGAVEGGAAAGYLAGTRLEVWPSGRPEDARPVTVGRTAGRLACLDTQLSLAPEASIWRARLVAPAELPPVRLFTDLEVARLDPFVPVPTASAADWALLNTPAGVVAQRATGDRIGPLGDLDPEAALERLRRRVAVDRLLAEPGTPWLSLALTSTGAFAGGHRELPAGTGFGLAVHLTGGPARVAVIAIDEADRIEQLIPPSGAGPSVAVDQDGWTVLPGRFALESAGSRRFRLHAIAVRGGELDLGPVLERQRAAGELDHRALVRRFRTAPARNRGPTPWSSSTVVVTRAE